MKEGKNKGKKWIIIISVLILIAIAVTLIIVFWPKDAGQVVQMVNSQSQTMYLKNKDDETNFKEFQNKINSNLSATAVQETQNIYEMFGVLNTIVDFYNQNLIYAEDNSNFQNNIGTVVRSLDSATSAQKRFNQSLADFKRMGLEDSSFINGKWPDIKTIFLDYLNSYTKAIKGLSSIYQGCMPQGIEANELTYLVLDNVDNYLASISENFVDTQAMANAKRIEFLKSFLKYLTVPTLIDQYVFNTQLQSSVVVIKSFEEIYDTSFKALIDGINATDFTFTSTEPDQSGVLEKTENFLKGGLVA